MLFDRRKRNQIRKIFQDFIRNRVRAIRKLRIEDLNINPFLIRLLAGQMGFTDTRSIVRWLVAQRLERATVTSFGNALQAAAKVFSEGTGVEGADILKTRRGKHYHIQVKSGPNTIPKDLGVRISQLLRSAQRRNRGSVALFGMCYGTKDQVSGIVRQYVQHEGGIDLLSGREFWEFISDDPDCIHKIYQVAGEVSEKFRDESGRTLSEILESEIGELQDEFIRLYGTSETDMWDNLLQRNS